MLLDCLGGLNSIILDTFGLVRTNIKRFQSEVRLTPQITQHREKKNTPDETFQEVSQRKPTKLQENQIDSKKSLSRKADAKLLSVELSVVMLYQFESTSVDVKVAILVFSIAVSKNSWINSFTFCCLEPSAFFLFGLKSIYLQHGKTEEPGKKCVYDNFFKNVPTNAD